MRYERGHAVVLRDEHAANAHRSITAMNGRTAMAPSACEILAVAESMTRSGRSPTRSGSYPPSLY
jgi:hypothetical protein